MTLRPRPGTFDPSLTAGAPAADSGIVAAGIMIIGAAERAGACGPGSESARDLPGRRGSRGLDESDRDGHVTPGHGPTVRRSAGNARRRYWQRAQAAAGTPPRGSRRPGRSAETTRKPEAAHDSQ